MRGWYCSDLFHDILAMADRSEDGDHCLGIFGCSYYGRYKRMSDSLICVDILSADVGCGEYIYDSRVCQRLWQIHGDVNPLPWFHSGNAEFEQNLATLNDIRHGCMQSVRIFRPRFPNSEADHVQRVGFFLFIPPFPNRPPHQNNAHGCRSIALSSDRLDGQQSRSSLHQCPIERH